ncbi:hypothetical protein TRICI_000463 [Trichomonascus ciferrii]|uniref:Amidase domain-containing protein n=1 Tax=Trichomonascus ciferrii TaxID=44093 RepID=A0A642VDC4_9ASCO|nr:hypothetical protein TRICI_000463 [Trichomonascus ciferrii]
MGNETWEVNAEKAVKRRDEGAKLVDEYFPPLTGSKHWDKLPEPLPLNVTGVPKTMLDPVDYEIVETDPLELVQKIVNKKYTAVQVAGAYLRASIIAQRLVNCVAEFMPKEAYERAKYLDDYLEKNGRPVGPFHGLPISLKEMFGLKGHYVNASLTKFVDRIANEDAMLVDILRDAGGNFHIRTTQPQFIMHVEGDSNIHGRTSNPFNTNLTSGGSSAGEGASVGIHCSALGVGTDIGGSVRWPSSCEGLYGMRPSTGRTPPRGVYYFMPGCSAIASAEGPLARSVESAKQFLKCIVDSEPWKKDTKLNGIKWDSEPLKEIKKLRIGVLRSDGVVTPHPPVLRAIDEVSAKLKAAKSIDGIEIELVPFSPYKHDECWEIISSLYFEDGGEEILKFLEDTDEPIMPLTKWILTENKRVRNLGIRGLWDMNNRKNQYKDEYIEHWNKHNIDALIAPVGPGSAAEHGNSKYWNYTAQWNLLDYPSITFPVTQVDPAKDKPNTSYKPMNELDKTNHELYSPEKFIDAPIGLQLVGLRSEDEKVLEIMRLIDKTIR